MSFVTPLRYPGGKGRLGHWLRDILAANNLGKSSYVEPFAGGAGAAVFLLTNGYVPKIHINDLDPLIYSFWIAVTQHTADLAARVRKATVTLDARERAKEVIRSTPDASVVDLAFAVFLLNRTSRSGIIHGGPIGGRNQDGKYRVDARFNHEGLAQRIERIGNFSKQITVTNDDAADLLSDISRKRNQFIYCDPPYYVKGEQLYKNHYSDPDHMKIAQLMRKLRSPWIVTYDDNTRISELYADAPHMKFSLHYSTHLGRPKAQELLFYENLTLPAAPYLHR